MYNEELIFDFCLPPEELKEPLRVCVTGAGGHVAYSLLHSIANGDVFGPNQLITLLLYDSPAMTSVLKSVVMELQDCSFELLHEVSGTSDHKVAFNSIDVAIMLASEPLCDDKKDVIKANTKLYQEIGKTLDKYAKKRVKVIVVGESANTNCFVLSECAPSIPKTNFTCMSRVDQNRAVSQLALRLGVKIKAIKNVIIWGNRSATKYPDLEHATVCLSYDEIPVKEVLCDDKWIEETFAKHLQGRDAAAVRGRTPNGGLSVAKAIADHLVAWLSGKDSTDFFSMGVLSDGSFDVPKDLYCSFPVIFDHEGYRIVNDLHLSKISREKLSITVDELSAERSIALSYLNT